MIREKSRPRFCRSIQNDANVLVPCGPGVADVFRYLFLVDRRQAIPKPIERGPQRTPPFLVPRMSARVATAVRTPAFDPVDATPGTVVNDFNEVSRRILFEELAVVR